MRIQTLSVMLVLAVGLPGCKNSASKTAEQQTFRPAPILSPGVVNPPMIETQRQRGGPQAIIIRTIPAGVTIQIRNNEIISLKTAHPGDTFPGVVTHDVVDGSGRVAIPTGSAATLVVLASHALDIGGVEVAGRRYGLEASKRGNAGARASEIPAKTLLSFRLDAEARIRELH